MSATSIVSNVRETTRFRPVGRCIYCGSASNLSDEHIVSYGLGGKLVLPNSSCAACSIITSRIERKVLQGFMLPARTVAGFPTRRPKQRPTEFELEARLNNGENIILSLEAPEFPALLPLPRFPEAGFLRGMQTSSGLSVIGRDTIRFGKPHENLLRRLSAELIRVKIDVDAYSFAQMLAKIGYAYFVAINGIVDLAAVPVLPFIKGERDDGDLWIGSAAFETESERKGALHVIQVSQRDLSFLSAPVHVVRVKLFAASGADGYEVVTHMPT